MDRMFWYLIFDSLAFVVGLILWGLGLYALVVGHFAMLSYLTS